MLPSYGTMSSQYQGTSSRPFTSSYFRPQHSTFNERAKKNIGRDDLEVALPSSLLAIPCLPAVRSNPRATQTPSICRPSPSMFVHAQSPPPLHAPSRNGNMTAPFIQCPSACMKNACSPRGRNVGSVACTALCSLAMAEHR